MKEHHRRVIGRLVERLEQDPNFPALIVGGSVAKGWEKDDSDIDIMLVAGDQEYARRAATRAFSYYATDLCDYAGGYVDGKIVDRAFLEDVAARGSEPARAAFWKAFLAYSRIPELESPMARIAVYPEAERRDKMRSFYAQVQALLAQLSKSRADAFARTVLTFAEWDQPPEGWVSRFLEDSEWTWRRGNSPLADW